MNFSAGDKVTLKGGTKVFQFVRIENKLAVVSDQDGEVSVPLLWIDLAKQPHH